MYVEVLVEITSRQVDQTFTYHVPISLEKEIGVGKRVTIPFGKQTLEGFIIKVHHEKPEYETKDIINVTDHHPVLNEEQLLLGK